MNHLNRFLPFVLVIAKFAEIAGIQAFVDPEILKAIFVLISAINQIFDPPRRRKRSSSDRIVIHCCETHKHAGNGS
jgi:hypothetical protein